MRGIFQSLPLVAAALATASLLAWMGAYSPLSCYETLPRVAGWPPAVCDPRFGLTFVFIKDSFANILAVLGVPAAIAVLVLRVTWKLIRCAHVMAATVFSSLALLALWGFLIWWLDRSPYLCAFGFGGFGCSGVIESVGLNAIFLGWLLPIAALVCIPVVGRRAGRKHDT